MIFSYEIHIFLQTYNILITQHLSRTALMIGFIFSLREFVYRSKYKTSSMLCIYKQYH